MGRLMYLWVDLDGTCVDLDNEMVAKLFLLQFYLFGCVIVRLRKMLFAVAGLRPQNILLVFLASLENLKFRYEIVLQPSQYVIIFLIWMKNYLQLVKPLNISVFL